MGRRPGPLGATDAVERRLLEEIDARGEGGREEAAKQLKQKRDVIDRMWSSSSTRRRRDMRLHEARTLADWLGYDLDLRKPGDAISALKAIVPRLPIDPGRQAAILDIIEGGMTGPGARAAPPLGRRRAASS